MQMPRANNGFTLVEMIVVVAVIAIVLSMVLGVGKHIKDQAKIKAAESTVIVLTSALEQYCDDKGRMPFETIDSVTLNPLAVDELYDIDDFQTLLAGTITFMPTNTHTGKGYDDDWSSEAMYYYLSKNPNSRTILRTLNESNVRSLNLAGDALTVDIVDASANYIETNKIMPRIVDPWGNAYRYRYESGNSFCRIVSAGPDGNFATPGDNITN